MLRWLLALLALPVLALLAALWWMTRENSLPQALRLAQRLLPEGQQLVFSDAEGSVARGGSIGRLQWRSSGTEVIVDALRLDWSWHLLDRYLYVRTLAAAKVQVHLVPQPPDPSSPPFRMPDELSLPLRLRVPLAVQRLEVGRVDEAGQGSAWIIENIAAGYAFDGEQHALRVARLRQGRSSLQARLRLHARELSLAAQLDAALRDPVPDRPFAMQVRLEGEGVLAGEQAAQLEVRLDATEQGTDGTSRMPASVRARAEVHPFRGQPLQRLELAVAGLDARAFHAAAPVTALRGNGSVTPLGGEEATWEVALDLSNGDAGSWEQARLPLQGVTLRGRLSRNVLALERAEATAGTASEAGRVVLDGEIPLQRPAQSTLHLVLQQVDMQPWMQGLPRTNLDGEITMGPAGQRGARQVSASITNSASGPLDLQRLPMDRLSVQGLINPQRWLVQDLLWQVGAGQARLQGAFEPQAQSLELRGELHSLPLHRIHRGAGAQATLAGTLGADGNLTRGVDFTADLAGNAAGRGADPHRWEIRAIQARGSWSPTRLRIQRVHLDAFDARLEGGDIEIALPAMEALQARVSAAAPGLTLEADANMRQRTGGGRLSVALESAADLVRWLEELPFVGGRYADVSAAGSGSVNAEWQGGWQQWREGLRRPAAFPALNADVRMASQGLRLSWPSGTAGAPPTTLDVERVEVLARGNLAAAELRADARLRVDDARADLAVDLGAQQQSGRAGAPRWTVTLEELTAAVDLDGGNDPWRFQVSQGLQGTLQTGAEPALETTQGHARLVPPRSVAAEGESLGVDWQPLQWSRDAEGATRLTSSGEVRGLHLGWVDALLVPTGRAPLAAAGLYTDLVLRGQWDVRLAEQLDVRARVSRVAGDLWLGQSGADSALATAGGARGNAAQAVQQARREGVAAGIRNLELTLDSDADDIALGLDWETERAGVIEADLRSSLARRAGGWSVPDDAPLSGHVRVQMQDLGTWGFLTPPGWRVQGELDANVTLRGTLQSPDAEGGIEVDGLRIRSVLDGVDLRDGILRARLQGQRLEITELSLLGGTGSRANVRGISGNRSSPPREPGRMVATGLIDWSRAGAADAAGSGIRMDLRATLERMQVLVRNDRQLSLGGELSAGLEQGRLRVRGDLTVIRAAIMLPDARAPTLGDDVVVVRSGDTGEPPPAGRLQTSRPMDVEIRIDLGRDLALQGHGITTRLEGQLTVSSATGGVDPFRVVGEVRTVEGRFRAWNQALNVETGVILFNGPYTNPSLNLLAIRPEIEVRAGVRVTGTLEAPRMTLFSEPEMSEAEKLSWIVLGRATATSSSEGASMQQAALTMLASGLGGSVAGDLGLDELAVSESSVSIGKRISNELYVTYEAGLAGAASTLFIFYDITRRLTLRGQTSEASALDLIYTRTYD